MRIKKIELHNFRAAKDLSLDLQPGMNLFVGVNGAGKSTVLQALSCALLQLVRKIHNSMTRRSGTVQVSDITSFQDYAQIKIEVLYKGEAFFWELVRSRPGINVAKDEDGSQLIDLSKSLKNQYSQNKTLPVMAFYPTNRVVGKNLIIMSRESANMERLDIYDNALEGTPNFQNFFRWFRERDDYLNQKSLSRSKWIKRNAARLSNKILKILDKMESLFEDRKEYFEFRKGIRRFESFLQYEPRFIFRELSELLLRTHIAKVFGQSDFSHIVSEFDYMLHKMEKMGILLNEKQNAAIDSFDGFAEIISRVLKKIFLLQKNPINKKSEEGELLWLMFSLACDLGLWWLSDNSHRCLESELLSILEPAQLFSLSETDVENLQDTLVKTVDKIIESDIQKRSEVQKNPDRELQYVTRAIEAFVPAYKNLRVNRLENGSAHMLVDKNDQEFDIGLLSDGEKNLIAMIGDIARRLTIGNPDSESPLEESGIILIDELELHLHPKWQRVVAERLTEVFPNCQFIISSHSPQVISHVKPESIIVLKNIEGEIVKSFVNDSYWKNSDRILEDIMETFSRPEPAENELRLIYRLIQEGKISEAQQKISALRSKTGEDGELRKAEILIKRREIIGK